MTQQTEAEKYMETLAGPAPGKSTLHITDATGDRRIMWDPNDKADVKFARDAFDQAKAQGMLAYAVEDDGSKGEVLQRFDKTRGKIIMTRQLAGG